MRVVFFGTPEFAVPTLEGLAGDSRFEVALVVTQPDRPAGRGRKVESSAVARFAVDHQLPLYQPETLKHSDARRPLAEVGADLFVVAAFGLIFGPKTLAIPRHGCVNVHASLLPRYRGASPVPAAILYGDRTTGVTLMMMEAGLDTGPTVAVSEEAIRDDDTSETLLARLGRVGARLALHHLPRVVDGWTVPTPQPTAGASLTRPLTKADGWLDFEDSATALERRVRAMWPWPRAWTTLDDEPVQVHRATPVLRLGPNDATEPGTVVVRADGPHVRAVDGWLRLDLVQPAGGRPMSGVAFAAGRRLDNARLGTAGEPIGMPPVVVPA